MERSNDYIVYLYIWVLFFYSISKEIFVTDIVRIILHQILQAKPLQWVIANMPYSMCKKNNASNDSFGDEERTQLTCSMNKRGNWRNNLMKLRPSKLLTNWMLPLSLINYYEPLLNIFNLLDREHCELKSKLESLFCAWNNLPLV